MNSGERIRLFVGAVLPDEHLAAIDASVQGLKRELSSARWAPVEKQHVTLKFLGWAPVELLDAVGEQCGQVSASIPHGHARVTQLGGFPSVRRARVLWAGIDDVTRTFAGLASGLDDALASLGFEAEKRAYTPHLTLARFKAPARLEGVLPELDVEDLAPFPVAETVLFRSRLSPKGARYEQIARFPLG